MFDVLAPGVVTRRAIEIGKPFVLPGGLTAELFTVPGKVPLYLERGTFEIAAESGANVGVEITRGRRAALLRARRRERDAGLQRHASRAPTSCCSTARCSPMTR